MVLPAPPSSHPSLTAKALKAIYGHARRDYPNECCGIAYGPRHLPIADHATACENIQNRLHAQNPTRFSRDMRRAYSLAPRDMAALRRSLRSNTPAKIVYHSHIDVGSYFSAADQEGALFEGEPSYPIEYLVVDVRADGTRGATQFAWDAKRRIYVEVGAYP